MNMALLWLSVGVAALGSGMNNFFGKKRLATVSDGFLYSGVSALFSALLLLALASNRALPSPYTFWMGALYGTVSGVSQFFAVRALMLGPLSFTSMFGAFAMIIPTMFGAIFWKEPVTVFQIVGVILLLGSFYFFANPRKERSVTVRWLLCCLVVFFASGSVGVLQKLHQTSRYRQELDAFLVVAFVTSTILFILLALSSVKFKKEPISFRKSTLLPVLAMAAVSGMCAGVCNKLNLYLSGQMPSMLFFPLVNGGGVVAATLVGVFLFRERLSRLQLVGLILGTLAILLISNLFGG